MSVISQGSDGRVTCGWLEDGEVRVARLPIEALEEVSALDDEATWLRAFREQGEVFAYLRKRHT